MIYVYELTKNKKIIETPHARNSEDWTDKMEINTMVLPTSLTQKL